MKKFAAAALMLTMGLLLVGCEAQPVANKPSPPAAPAGDLKAPPTAADPAKTPADPAPATDAPTDPAPTEEPKATEGDAPAATEPTPEGTEKKDE